MIKSDKFLLIAVLIVIVIRQICFSLTWGSNANNWKSLDYSLESIAVMIVFIFIVRSIRK